MPSNTINALWRSLLELNRNLKQTLCLLSTEAEVPPSAVSVIFKLEHETSMKINCIAEYLGITIGAASNLIDRLEEKGWTQRLRSEEDRRITYVSLTPEGMQQLLTWRSGFADHAEAIFAKLDPQRLQGLDEAVTDISLYLGNYNTSFEEQKKGRS
ncbi:MULTISPECIES: MarR family winged helix-turn-helix transcriptional regulator [Paenibacillus]|uniref:MarR family winged helix-turn-helix transcriptional regulator n=1 Tax=Paenibacillus TaxID=44249 RepID=UPI0022B90D30|nr:MarR family transcriptional regulator [Paenibacillus caseinilyticus]MCZ8523958.1 MarR family transcriptional regulator [Paenibacillus caseinilyticus]